MVRPPARCWRHVRRRGAADTLPCFPPPASACQDVSSLQVAGTRQTGEDVRSQNGALATRPHSWGGGIRAAASCCVAYGTARAVRWHPRQGV